eukprot:CCRYP_016730-RA/>CCRYP_016730-RA protein AED:0.37 eAED:0.87 QI:0/0/0/1/1/1/2/0/331
MLSSCTHHFLDRAKEKYLILTDTDEFLSFNFILPDEDISHFNRNSIFSLGAKDTPSIGKRARDRLEAWPIRAIAGRNPNQTILSFIESQQELQQTYFPAQSGCTRIVGLAYGTNTTDDLEDEPLMTKKYQHRQKYPHDKFSKVMLELPKISESRDELNHIESIHNPFPKLCGMNGKHSSGQDFSGSVLKVAHYVGTIEGWLERGGGKGSHLYRQDRKSWEDKNTQFGPYTEELDLYMGAWVDFFIAKVGIHSADELLYKPIRQRIRVIRDVFMLIPQFALKKCNSELNKSGVRVVLMVTRWDDIFGANIDARSSKILYNPGKQGEDKRYVW